MDLATDAGPFRKSLEFQRPYPGAWDRLGPPGTAGDRWTAAAEMESVRIYVMCRCREAAHLQRLSTFGEYIRVLSPEGCTGGAGCVT